MTYLNQAKVLLPEQISILPKSTSLPHVLVVQKADMDITLPKNNVVKAILAEQFDPSYRLDLIHSRIVPLLFKFSMNRDSLQIQGGEYLDFMQLSRQIRPKMDWLCRMTKQEGQIDEFVLRCGIETKEELEFFYPNQ